MSNKELSAMSNNERGFTLIEAVVAMMVCTIGLVAMAELMAVTLRLQQLGRNQTSAVRLAQDKVDELTTKSFTTNPQAACGGSIDADVANHNDIPKEDNGTPDNTADDTITKGYKRRWLIVAGPDGDTNLRQVTVRVIPDSVDYRTSAPYDLTTFIRNGNNVTPPPVCP
jgi:Rib/alpha/Esp surface antigen-like repeat protein